MKIKKISEVEKTEIEKAAKLMAQGLPVQWQDDCRQEIFLRCLEARQEAKLTPAIITRIAYRTRDYIWRHYVHDEHGHEHEHNESLDSPIMEQGEDILLHDAIASSACYANVEAWALARMALGKLTPRIRELSLIRLQGQKLSNSEVAELLAWKAEYLDDTEAQAPTPKAKREAKTPITQQGVDKLARLADRKAAMASLAAQFQAIDQAGQRKLENQPA